MVQMETQSDGLEMMRAASSWLSAYMDHLEKDSYDTPLGPVPLIVLVVAFFCACQSMVNDRRYAAFFAILYAVQVASGGFIGDIAFGRSPAILNNPLPLVAGLVAWLFFYLLSPLALFFTNNAVGRAVYNTIALSTTACGIVCAADDAAAMYSGTVSKNMMFPIVAAYAVIGSCCGGTVFTLAIPFWRKLSGYTAAIVPTNAQPDYFFRFNFKCAALGLAYYTAIYHLEYPMRRSDLRLMIFVELFRSQVLANIQTQLPKPKKSEKKQPQQSESEKSKKD